MFKRVFLAVVIFLLSFRPVQAEGEFATNYQVDYTVDTLGLTHVTMDVELKNNLSNIYASEFTVSIGSTNIDNIQLTLGGEKIEPNIAQGNKTTNITVVFPDKVLGKDKSQRFALKFTSRDFSRRVGQVWEVTIPRLAKTDDVDNYSLSLSIPTSFGGPSIISPKPISKSAAGQNTVYRFSAEDLYTGGIAATFGQEQSFVFSLDYYLNNPYLYPIQTEISLPPDTAWQQVLYETIEPKPQSVSVDEDGNWLANYRLGSQEKLTVTASGSARLFLQPRSDYPLAFNSQVDYLKSQQFWEADNPRIKAVAQQASTAQQIYQYVVENLIYDYGRLGQGATRLGAANALDNQDSALCLEFTDLFIAVARAAGIPARAANGYAYTDNASLRPLSLKQDVLHAWPEYYDAKRELWIPIDPTWGNTTGGVDFFSQPDLNHFTFSIQGKDSNYPIPAGGYKNGDDPVKSVFVDFGKSLTAQPKLSLEFKLPHDLIAGVNLSGELDVVNTGNIALYDVPVTINTNQIQLESDHWQIPVLPPGARTTLAFNLPATGWNAKFSDVLTAQSGETTAAFNVNVTPAYNLLFSRLALILALGLLALFSMGLVVRAMLKWKR
jgi:transglutaminase-like putative cysteine protease